MCFLSKNKSTDSKPAVLLPDPDPTPDPESSSGAAADNCRKGFNHYHPHFWGRVWAEEQQAQKHTRLWDITALVLDRQRTAGNTETEPDSECDVKLNSELKEAERLCSSAVNDPFYILHYM